MNGRPDTLALLPALAAVTQKVGLAATLSTTYNEPYELARQLASLDHVSGGRAGWNVVTSFSNSAAKDAGGDGIAFNHSRERHLEHATRYDRAREFVALVQALWDSGGEARPLNHIGRWFKVAGPLDVPRPPQGRPIIIQAGQSPDGRDLAARIADVVFSPHRRLEDALEYAGDLTRRLAALGRSRNDVRILPGLSVIVAPTEEEAHAKAARYRALLLTDGVVRYLLSEPSGANFDGVDLDAAFPDPDVTAPEVNGPLLERWTAQAREEGLTPRQLVERTAPRPSLVGTPTQVADHIQTWLEAGASDGFLLSPTLFPNDLDDFVDLAVPELQRRGLFRTAYAGATLRDHLGLRQPVPAQAEEVGA